MHDFTEYQLRLILVQSQSEMRDLAAGLISHGQHCRQIYQSRDIIRLGFTTHAQPGTFERKSKEWVFAAQDQILDPPAWEVIRQSVSSTQSRTSVPYPDIIPIHDGPEFKGFFHGHMKTTRKKPEQSWSRIKGLANSMAPQTANSSQQDSHNINVQS